MQFQDELEEKKPFFFSFRVFHSSQPNRFSSMEDENIVSSNLLRGPICPLEAFHLPTKRRWLLIVLSVQNLNLFRHHP